MMTIQIAKLHALQRSSQWASHQAIVNMWTQWCNNHANMSCDTMIAVTTTWQLNTWLPIKLLHFHFLFGGGGGGGSSCATLGTGGPLTPEDEDAEDSFPFPCANQTQTVRTAIAFTPTDELSLISFIVLPTQHALLLILFACQDTNPNAHPSIEGSAESILAKQICPQQRDASGCDAIIAQCELDSMRTWFTLVMQTTNFA